MGPTFAEVFAMPLFRLLAVNLAIGIAVALLMIGGLLVLNPYGLRDLIAADHSSGAALALLVMGFVVTFGSTAMGSAIMALGADTGANGGGSPAPAVMREAAAVRIKARPIP
jgi:hypothetical protein